MTARRIHLGFEIPSGDPVLIPLRHTVVTGQTQEAGKTTTLEALVHHGRLRSLVFVTKRGEGKFANAHQMTPYFREQADWQFVASVLEASRGERLKFERAWIIRASKGARTLADVQRNVREALKKAKGLSADVYLTLDAYLEVVVPEIARVRWASSWQLGEGLNVMDLTALSVELQHLVIRSSITRVLEDERDTIVVVPEAWKFIPQGRNTPVKLAAESFIRQAAALGNYLWLDSQDIGGIEKAILRSVAVWILGVQRETNEIKRTLENIPAGVSKPKPADIATLELGQFFACHGKTAVKSYVQPAWMSSVFATRIAQGFPLTKAEGQALMKDQTRAYTKEESPQVTNEEARALHEENRRLSQRVAELERLLPGNTPRDGTSSNDKAPGRSRGQDASSEGHRATAPSGGDAGSTPAVPFGFPPDFYKQLKALLIADLPTDPEVLRLVVTRPQLRVVVERPTMEITADTLFGRIAMLIAEGFFDSVTAGNAAFNELQRRGIGSAKPNVYREADKLTSKGFLTKEDGGYLKAPHAVVTIIDA